MKLPFGLGFVNKVTLYGSQSSPYMTRYVYTRDKVDGDRRLQIFHRGDEDPDPHDHPWDFWTFPLVDYYEELWLFDPKTSLWYPKVNEVQAFRWHFRPANYKHRVLTPIDGSKIITLVKTGPVRQKWSFYRRMPRQRFRSIEDYLVGYEGRMGYDLIQTPWREYLRLK